MAAPPTRFSPRAGLVLVLLAFALVAPAAAGGSGSEQGTDASAAGDTAAPKVRIAGSRPRCSEALSVRVSVSDRSPLRRVKVAWRGRTLRSVRAAGANRTVRLGLKLSRTRLRRPGQLVVDAVDAAGNRGRGRQDFIPCRSPSLTG